MPQNRAPVRKLYVNKSLEKVESRYRFGEINEEKINQCNILKILCIKSLDLRLI
ncbi:hypothetical protein IFVP177_C1120033 [Vibrio parahaemolyticus]